VAADQPGERRRTTCPDCGGPVRPEHERLCPRCGYPLMFLHAEPEPEARLVARAPGEPDDATAVFSAAPAAPEQGYTVPAQRAPSAGGLVCARCGQDNPSTRVRCQRCGRELRVVQAAAIPPPPLPPPPPPVRRPLPWGLIAAAILLALLLALLVYLLLTR
jgi:predicted amidophosphoribosyltransferase